MKQKLLTLFTLLLTVCSGAWATDETPGNTGDSNTAVSGKSYTIAGTYVAGKGGKQTSPMESKGVKVRLTASGTNNSLTITVNDGYIINDLTIYAVTNTDNASCTVTSVKVDGENAGTAPYTIAAKNASTASTIALTDIDATESIVLSFGNVGGSGEATQAHFDFHFTYTQIPAGPSISASNVNIAASAIGGSIAYTVNNPVDGGVVTAAEKGTSGWLTAVGTEPTSPISFTAEANTGAERSATVTLTYTYNTSETVEKDVTITQAAKTYTITYNKGTYGTGEIAAGQKNHGVAFTLSSEKFTRAGYEQTGWATSDGGDKAYELGGSYTANADIELFPVWEEAKYTVTYNVNGGGSCATESATQPTVGAALTLPTPTWTGYTFDGWYNAGSKIEGDSYTPTANITLYAKWTDNIEGKIFSYVDGNYGDKFKAFDGSGWVTADTDNKSKTFTDGTTGAQYIITNGTWENKNNSISALAKFKNGTTEMSIVIPSGYAATVKILYSSYNTDRKLTVNGENQEAITSTLSNGASNVQVANAMKEVTLENQTGTLTLGCSVAGQHVYIGRVAVTLTHVSATISDAGWNTFSSKVALDLSTLSATSEVKAYYASAASDGKVTMSSTDASVPAGEGLMIKGTVGEVFTIDAATGNGTNIVGNLLEGLPNGGTVAKGANNYVFAWQTGNVSTTAGFYYVNDAEPTLDAGKAYLHTTTPLSGKLNIIIDDSTSQEEETDGIKAVSTNVENGVRYNLAGQKVGADYKGIVIVNGKKYLRN